MPKIRVCDWIHKFTKSQKIQKSRRISWWTQAKEVPNAPSAEKVLQKIICTTIWLQNIYVQIDIKWIWGFILFILNGGKVMNLRLWCFSLHKKISVNIIFRKTSWFLTKEMIKKMNQIWQFFEIFYKNETVVNFRTLKLYNHNFVKT